MANGNLATGPKRLETELTIQISQDGTFIYYTFFVLNIPVFNTLSTFSYRNFFSLSVCFDIV